MADSADWREVVVERRQLRRREVVVEGECSVRREARRGRWGQRGDLLGRRITAKARREGVLMIKFSNTEKTNYLI
jgi:hypothetical protein